MPVLRLPIPLVLALLAAAAAAQVPSAPVGPPPAPVQPAVVSPAPVDFESGGGNDWFEKTRLNLGTFLEEESATGEFKFKNPREVAHKFTNLQPSCACARAVVEVGDRKYEISADRQLYRLTSKDGVETKERVTHINVAPGEGGKVQVYMTMTGIRGHKEADLTVQTSDEAAPMLNLKWRATGATYFTVEPPEVNLNEMSWEDKRDFEFRVTSPMRPDFNLLAHDPLPAAMQVETRKEMQDGKAVWFVKGTYGPGAGERDAGGPITFKTDADGKSVTARVIAFVKGPLTMKPGGFVSLGNVRCDSGGQVEITLAPGGSFDLQVEKLEVERLSLKAEQRQLLTFDHHKEGKDVKVVIRVEKGMAPTYLNGVLKIHLNHPAAKMKEVMFNGFVR